MSDIYERLAKKLEDSPTANKEIELPILQRIFAPEEAELAVQLDVLPETVETIAERLGKPVVETQSILDNMVKKGQVAHDKERKSSNPLNRAEQDVFFLLPFDFTTCRQCVNQISSFAEFCPC